jgi:hypothetical protein
MLLPGSYRRGICCGCGLGRFESIQGSGTVISETNKDSWGT